MSLERAGREIYLLFPLEKGGTAKWQTITQTQGK